MGLFDRFKKQDCEICGKEVGMFGYKKLKDGEICKDCVKLLSPWFEDRKESTVAQIKAQIAYRAQNAEELKSFNPTKVYGDFEYMYVEERDGVPYRFCVSRNKDYLKENADLVLVEDLEAVIIDIDDNAFKSIEAIINSMTPKERTHPEIINGSRRTRIAKGSGTNIQEVNRLLKQFDQTRKMMKMAVDGSLQQKLKGFRR